MTKKIYDIIPPEERNELVEEQKEKRSFLFPKKVFIIPLLFLLILGGLFYFTTEPKAKISVWPETERMDSKTSLTVSANENSLNFSEKIIPGQIVEVEKTVSQEFSSSGKSLKKAEGTIRLFNKFATWPETWAQGTRFISGDGKLFVSKSKIHVPAAEKEGSKKVASFVDVEVIAAEPGEEYNIKPTEFSIYAYRGTARYSYYWGESYERMEGGGESVKVTEEDLEDAKDSLSQKAISQSKSLLVSEAEKSANSIIVEDLIESEIIDFSPLAEVDQEVDSFTAQSKAKSKTITFKEKDLERFASLYILNKTDQNKEIFEESLEIECQPSFLSENRDKKIENGSILVNLDLSGSIYEKIDFNLLKKEIAGNNIAEAESDILNSFQKIKKVEVEVWPFWARRIPSNLEQIEINLEQ
jgi:hypothetical protein